VKSSQTYNVAVRMDDGSTRQFSYKDEPAFRAGDKVKVVDGGLVAR
jgi:outer membrane lipoprotein SlyB